MKHNEDWYNNLIKPKHNPPPWVFRVVWIILYILMFIAFGLIYIEKFSWLSGLAYFFFFIQLGVNALWKPAFFKEHNLRKAFLLSALLTLLVFITMFIFFKISKIAGYLFLPYFLWCSFATILSFEILDLNEW